MAKYLVVDREKIAHNIKLIRKQAGSARIYGVLKGNAYGFGLLEMADLLRSEGISQFAVTELRDLIMLRNAGFVDEEVLVLRSTALQEEIELLIEYNGTATIGSYDAAVAINGIAEKNGAVIAAHIEIDTGMGRYGFLPEEYDRVLNVYKYLSSLQITGIYTHFTSAFSSAKKTKAQFDQFMTVVEFVRRAGCDPGVLHTANSSALFRFPYTVLDAVRVGSALTGRVAAAGNFGLQKTGYAESQVIEVRWLHRKQTVGYGAEYTCKKSTRIAVVPLGYGDGFCIAKQGDMFTLRKGLLAIGSAVKSWILRKKTMVTVGGKPVPVLGHVGMQHTVIDVTDADCAVGDTVRFEVNPVLAGAMLPKKFV